MGYDMQQKTPAGLKRGTQRLHGMGSFDYHCTPRYEILTVFNFYLQLKIFLLHVINS